MELYSYLLIVLVSVIFFIIVYKKFSKSSLSFENYIVDRNNISSFNSVSTLTSSVLGAWILFSPAEAGTLSGINGIFGYSIGQALPFFAFAIISYLYQEIPTNTKKY